MISGAWRRVVGLVLLSTTVFLWTASSFLASAIFADASYSKPFLVTYFNNALFSTLLLPLVSRYALRSYRQRFYKSRDDRKPAFAYSAVPTEEGYSRNVGNHENLSGTEIRGGNLDDDVPHNVSTTSSLLGQQSLPPLTVRETFWLSSKFGIFWFVSNYFNSGCLQFTTVASATIISCTSSIFTLILGTVMKVEVFTWKKLIALVACISGVAIISNADVSGNSGDRGSFPDKSPQEIGLGDGMALIAAMLYGFYAVLFVKVAGDETRINMPLFYGIIGTLTTLMLWPFIFIFDWSNFEPFELPPDGRTWAIVIINGVSSVVADVAWAYSLLFISPLVVTVGLSMTIPISLTGQMIINHQYASGAYWVGAVVVLSSFIFLNYESKPSQEQRQDLSETENR